MPFSKLVEKELSYVINFGAERVQVSRVVNTKGKAKLLLLLPQSRNIPQKPKQLATFAHWRNSR